MRAVLHGRPVSKKNGWHIVRCGGFSRLAAKKETKVYVKAIQDQFKLQATAKGWEFVGGREEICAAFFVYFHPRQRMDVHNACETVLDALQGVAFENDRQVVGFYTPPYRLIDRDDPRVEIVLKKASEVRPNEAPAWATTR